MFNWRYQDTREIANYLYGKYSCVVSIDKISFQIHNGRSGQSLDIITTKGGVPDQIFSNIRDYKKYIGMKGFLKVKKGRFSDPVDCIFIDLGNSRIELICDSIFTDGHIERHELGKLAYGANEDSLRFFTSERDLELNNEVLAVETLKEELRKCKEFLADPWKEYREVEKTYNKKLESKKARTEYKIQRTTEVVKILEEKLPTLTEYVIRKNLMSGSESNDQE